MGKRLIINALEPYPIDATHPPHLDDIEWALANYLLVDAPGTYQAFLTSGDVTAGRPFEYVGEDVSVDAYRAPIGQPEGPMSWVGPIAQRSFSGGLAAVNPGSVSATLTLTGAFVGLDGRRVVGALVLAPRSGAVLLSS
jgi:hypothetical protein